MNANRAVATLRTLILALMTLIAVFPFYVMLAMGTQSTEALFTGATILPGRNLLANFRSISESNFLRYFVNSLYVSGSAAVLTVVVSAMTGFAFAKYEFGGKRLMYNFILATMMIPTGLGLIAFLQEMKIFGWTNTHLPLIIPGAANAFGVFLMTSFMKAGIPTEVIESARMDGCNEFRVFLQIALPFAAPAVAALLMLTFIWSWNNYLMPLIMINRDRLFTVPLGISNLGSMYRADIAARILALSIGTVPLLVVFAMNSRAFIRGLTVGAIKG